MKLSDMEFLSNKDDSTWKKINATTTSGRIEEDIVERFYKVVATNPSEQALSIRNDIITYGELNDYSNQIARFLASQGIKSGDAVAVAIGVSTHLYAAILGILKIGGFYVPIGIDYPEERILYILENAQVKFLLTEAAVFTTMIETIKKVPLIVLEKNLLQKAKNVFDAEDVINFSKGNMYVKANPYTPAYMIYTSGTTGKPKGIKVSRDNVMNFVYWYCDAYGVSEKSRLAQNAPITFDPSVQQIFSAFMSGATLLPVPHETRTDPYLFLTWLRHEKVTHLDIVTSHWTHLLMMVDKTNDESLRILPDLAWIVIGGEALYYHQTHLWYRLVRSPARISGVYGPTEATINATYFIVDPEKADGKVPIGKPLPNYQIYVVNKQGKLCPPFIFGEIYIGGRGVALGYQDENQSKSSFIPNFFSDEIDGRLYKTGDIGRLVIDGEQNAFFEFKERADSQVKMSGYRIELGEIEAVAKGFSKIQDAAVVVRGEGIDKQLVCFFVSYEAKQTDLQSYFRSKLPGYMLPSIYCKVSNITYNSNGKVDRKGLLNLYENQSKIRRTMHILPSTPLEKTISAIWHDIFKPDTISVHDNFFDLGGNSYIALSFLANLQAQTDTFCRIADIYNYPTIADLAKHLEEKVKKERQVDKTDIQANIEKTSQHITKDQSHLGQYPLFFHRETDFRSLIAGAILSHEVFTENSEMEMSPSIRHDLLRGTRLSALTAINMRINMEVEKDILERVLRDILFAHPLLRAGIRKVGQDTFVFVEHSFEDIALPYYDLHEYGSEGIETAIGSLQSAFVKQMDLEKPPLFCFLLIREKPQVFRFIWFISHLISDGESINFLSREIQDRYGSYILGKPYQNDRENISYQDYVKNINLAKIKEPDILAYTQYIENYVDAVIDANRGIRLIVDKAQDFIEQSTMINISDMQGRKNMNIISTLYASYAKAISALCGINSVPVTNVYHGRVYNWGPRYLNVVGNLTDAIPVLISLHEHTRTDDLLSEISDILNFVNARKVNYARLFDQIREIKGAEYFSKTLLSLNCPFGFNFFEENRLDKDNSNPFELLPNIAEEYEESRKTSIYLSIIVCGDQLKISLLGSNIKKDAISYLWDLLNKEMSHFSAKAIQFNNGN